MEQLKHIRKLHGHYGPPVMKHKQYVSGGSISIYYLKDGLPHYISFGVREEVAEEIICACNNYNKLLNIHNNVMEVIADKAKNSSSNEEKEAWKKLEYAIAKATQE